MKLRAHHMRQKRRVPVCICAVWSGYSSSQARIVHREYFMVAREDVQHILDRSVVPWRFSDGTENRHSVNLVKNLQGLEPETLGYKELIREHFGLGTS